MMSERKTSMGRRDFLRTLGAGTAAAAVTSTSLTVEARADTETNDEKRKSRYKADSADIKNFYRVNRYPR
ncbi:MAG: twin-arginine translocation signal domain-containing protein [Variibacter sp.]